MIDDPIIQELRETRRKLMEACGNDPRTLMQHLLGVQKQIPPEKLTKAPMRPAPLRPPPAEVARHGRATGAPVPRRTWYSGEGTDTASGPSIRLFYRVAHSRFDDAEFLLAAGRTTGAVYLSGYGVECILKALLLSAVPAGERLDVVASFRGVRAHDYDWLKEQYRRYWHVGFPAELAPDFARVNTWSTDLRYQVRSLKQREAQDFMASAARIIRWAEGRL